MTSKPTNNETLVMTPNNGITVIQMGSNMAHGSQQVPPYSGNHLQGAVQLNSNPTSTVLKEYGQVFGTIQIMIGLLHIIFGAALGTEIFSYYTSLAFYGGYTIWGGLSFIISGSLSVSSQKNPTICLVNGSVAMNIISAIFSITGVLLFIAELCLNVARYSFEHMAARDRTGTVLSTGLLLFSLLEFSIACTASHYGCLISSCCGGGQVMMIIPNNQNTSPMLPSGPVSDFSAPDFSSKDVTPRV
ncbi:membrane-spanning 4-domains subfamily A member 8-like [Tachyglossus aculeatus]|uniref:membrane-spanning 4-domains subfamily A member 8-like n=1 Tax=Tachyglossus aculeatus TaxID=9261 RepID=UPI0018F315BD|nr:membrane-spanning 4-domains subfamily A member 8-like [Tachyglossus aculeatus]